MFSYFFNHKGHLLEHAAFIFVVVDGKHEKDFIKFARCKGRFEGGKCSHREEVSVTNVIVDNAHCISEPHLLSVLSPVSFRHLTLIGDVNQFPPRIDSGSLRAQPDITKRLSLSSRIVNGMRSAPRQGAVEDEEEDPLRLHRLNTRMRFQHPLLLRLQRVLLGLVGSNFETNSLTADSKLTPFHVFRVSNEPPADSLDVHQWSEVWTKVESRLRSVVCGVALLFKTLMEFDNELRVHVVVTSEALNNALTASPKMKAAHVELSSEIQVLYWTVTRT